MALEKDLVTARPRGPDPLSIAVEAGQEAQESLWFQAGSKSEHGTETDKESLKVKERCGNVYENKGSAFHRSARSWNLIENKDTYTSILCMLLKTSTLDVSHETLSHSSPRFARIAPADPFRASGSHCSPQYLAKASRHDQVLI